MKIIQPVLKLVCTSAVVAVTTLASAKLVSLDDNSLDKAVGQNGILIDAELRFNTTKATAPNLYNTINCAAGVNTCEMAARLQGDNSWLVLYDVSGGIEVKDLKITGSEVTSAGGTTRSALEIGDTTGNTDIKVKFDDFGASSIAFTPNNGATEGYRVTDNNLVPVGTSGLDTGKPKGIVGVRLNGTLTMTGGVKMFNCTGMGIDGC